MNPNPRKTHEPARKRAAIGCESLEVRAMLAMYVAREPGQFAAAPAQAQVETSLVAAPRTLATEPALLLAFRQLLADLATYAQRPQDQAAVQAVNDDLGQIALIVRQPGSQAVRNLTNDVSGVVAGGTFTTAQRTQIGEDLAAVFASTVPQPLFFTTAGASPTFLGVPGTPGASLLAFLSDPNALATVQSGVPRGQDTTDATAGAGNFALLGNATSPGDPQRAAYGKLITDLRAMLGKAPVPPALHADLLAATTGASRPDPRAVATLRTATTAVLSSGTFTDAQRAKLATDFAGVLTSAGIAPPVAERIAAGTRTALDAAGADAAGYRTIFEDVTAILRSAPARSPAGPGGWWFGRPPGL